LLIAAIATACFLSKVDAAEQRECNQWTDEQVKTEYAKLPTEPEDDPEKWRTALWEDLALCGYLWDWNSEHSLAILQWWNTSGAVNDHLSSLAMNHYLSIAGGHPTYPREGLNFGAGIDVGLVSWGEDGNRASFNPKTVSGSYRININQDLWWNGGFPHGDILHEIVHLQMHVASDYQSAPPHHTAEFRRAMMDAHINLNPYFDHGHTGEACRIAALLDLGLAGCDGEPWAVVSYSFEPHPEDAAPQTTPPAWTPLEVSEQTVTGNWASMSELHTGWWVWQMHRADGLDAYVACRTDTGDLHRKMHGGAWSETDVPGIRGHFGFAASHFIESAMADIAHACKIDVIQPEPENPEPAEVTPPTSVTIDPATGETILTYVVGSITCVIRSSGSMDCTDTSSKQGSGGAPSSAP
jgi:hypothetical protein